MLNQRPVRAASTSGLPLSSKPSGVGLSGQREHLVVKLIAGDVVPRKVGAHRQQDEVVAGSRDIYVNQQPAVRRLPWRQGIGVGLESRLTGVGESEGLYLVGWKTERGEHTFNGLGLALQVQAV